MKIDYAEHVDRTTSYMNEKYPFEGKKVLDIGCGDGNMVKRISSEYHPKHITGIDMYIRGEEIETENYSLISKINSNSLPFDDNSFDFIYSISTFEHIDDVKGTLSEIRRVLKPMGKFYTIFSPIWTSVTGHHVYCVEAAMREEMDHDEELVEAIPPWAHLYMSEDELCEHLEKNSAISQKRIEAVLHYIYHDSDINRHTASQTRDDFIHSGMIVRKYCERVSFSRQWALNNKGPSELTDDIINRIKNSNYSIDDIPITEMIVELEKYASL